MQGSNPHLLSPGSASSPQSSLQLTITYNALDRLFSPHSAFSISAEDHTTYYQAGDAGEADSTSGSGRSPGGGNGNLLQYSCLENPMDGEAWQATAHGIPHSRTPLSDLRFRFSVPCCCCSAAQSCPTLQPHGLQHARLPCPSLTPRTCSNSCPLMD